MGILVYQPESTKVLENGVIVCKNLVKIHLRKFFNDVIASSWFAVTSSKDLNQHIFYIFSHDVNNPVLKGICKFQANKQVNARVTAVNSKFRKSPNNYIVAAMMVGKRMSTSLL